MLYLKNPNFFTVWFCLFISINKIGLLIVTSRANFASTDMILMSLKGLHFEQYDGEVDSKLSFKFSDMTLFD